MAWVAPVVAIAGSLFQAKGQQDAGAAAQQSAEFIALEDEQAATNSRGASQRAAEEERRQGLLAQSRATALAAASGGGADDPTVVKIISNIAGESEYRALTALYQGEDRARAYENDASLRRAGGGEAMRAGQIAASGTLIQGGSSLLSRYGGNDNAPGTDYKPIAYRKMG
jgi:hypothetical protein